MALSKNTKKIITTALADNKSANELIAAVDAATDQLLIKSEDYSAVSGDYIMADTTTAAFTITLPPRPKFGQKVTVADFNDTWATNNVIVARNGSKIQGLDSDFTLNVSGEKVTFIFVGKNRGWNVVV